MSIKLIKGTLPARIVEYISDNPQLEKISGIDIGLDEKLFWVYVEVLIKQGIINENALLRQPSINQVNILPHKTPLTSKGLEEAERLKSINN